MKIALIGYGKMGHIIEEIALKRGHEIVCKIDIDNPQDFDSQAFASAEAAIEFTSPVSAADNVIKAVRRGVPVVCGSTGWDARRREVENVVKEMNGAMIASSNFSIGVFIFRKINHELSRWMSRFPQYSPSLLEVHHTAKKDHPSGTAITVANDMINDIDYLSAYSEDETGESILPVTCVREGQVPGIHCVTWKSDVDEITLKHEAFSRGGFALGAIMAAEWIHGKQGVFSIEDMLDSY